MQDLIDIGFGYDETDPFIDNSEAVSSPFFVNNEVISHCCVSASADVVFRPSDVAFSLHDNMSADLFDIPIMPFSYLLC